MTDDFGLVHSIFSPILGRVGREEALNRDHPQRNRDGKSARARADHRSADSPSDQAEDKGNSMSSTHIDLRI
jgi:hypothetical protein